MTQDWGLTLALASPYLLATAIIALAAIRRPIQSCDGERFPAPVP
jgi:hypothetical protein